MIGRTFRRYGEFCASHPWEVIVAMLMLTASMLAIDNKSITLESFSRTSETNFATTEVPTETTTTTTTTTSSNTGSATYQHNYNYQQQQEEQQMQMPRPCHGWSKSCDGLEAEYNAADVILMTIVRCTAVLYCYYQFCSLHKLGSKYVLGIAGLCTVFSSFIFTTTIIKFLGSDISDLKDAMFFLLLLIDLSNAGTLAQLALSGTNQAEVTSNIARGLELLGPAITLDTLVESLVIGVGTLSGVERLEVLCMFAVMSVIVNYIVFMTFYPACLSLVLELSRNGVDMSKMRAKAKESLIVRALSEEEHKANPVVQRVKIIMTTGLMVVHIYSRIVFSTSDYEPTTTTTTATTQSNLAPTLADLNQAKQNRTEPNELTDMIIKWLTVGIDQIVILILLIALAFKFIFFENCANLQDHMRQTTISISEKASQTAPITELADGAMAALTQTQTRTQKQTKKVNENQNENENGAYNTKTTTTLLENDLKFIVSKRVPLFSIEEQNLVNVATQTEISTIEPTQNKRLQLHVHSGGASGGGGVGVGVAHTSMLPPRPMQECLEILNSTDDWGGASSLTDDEIIAIVNAGGQYCPLYKIESVIGDPVRGVKIRRKIISARANLAANVLDLLPYTDFDYSKVMNVCCENVLGYVPIPVGYAGPLLLDGIKYFIPMATTEGALVASTNRGCKALSVRGVTSIVEDVGMTRAPCVRFSSIARAAEAKNWILSEENYKKIKFEFDSTSRFGRLKECDIVMDGRHLYLRFCAHTGDAMGMNMVSKGAEKALKCIKREFPDMQIISLSGNYCCDKKPSAINYIKGRGKKVFTECTIPAETLRIVLKTDAKTLVECNKLKNLLGSALAGSIGGNNAHAANMVTAVFLATGQDPAQNVTSSNCSTGMECQGEHNEDLYMTCTMPSLEVGTVGGGTSLPGQSACLNILGVHGAHRKSPGDNARKLAQIVCATVMAGELSLMAALVNSELVKSHMRHNRSSIAVSSDNNALNVTVSSCSKIS